jgi:hypothetical protein
MLYKLTQQSILTYHLGASYQFDVSHPYRDLFQRFDDEIYP